MKETRNTIIECAEHLIFEEKIKKITVKMIVEKSNVTRQTFYYHFTDIPDLFSHIIKIRMQNLFDYIFSMENIDECLKCFLEHAIETKGSIERVMHLNYGEEFEKLMSDTIYDFFKKSFYQNDIFKTYSQQQQEIFIQYHSSAIMHMIKISDHNTDIDMLANNIQSIIIKSLL